MTDWYVGLNFSDPCWPTTPIAARCDVCGRKDGTVKVMLIIRDYDLTSEPRPLTLAESQAIYGRRNPDRVVKCPKMCADCREDEPTSESLARRMIG